MQAVLSLDRSRHAAMTCLSRNPQKHDSYTPELALPGGSLEQLGSLELGGEHARACQHLQSDVVDANVRAVPLHLHLIQSLQADRRS